MKIKTSELQGAALDWAVAKCEGHRIELDYDYTEDKRFDGWWQLGPNHWQPLCKYSSVWALGGPIIEREMLDVHPMCPKPAWAKEESWSAHTVGRDVNPLQYGPTPLIAAMRCFVCSKLGDEVEIPQELR